MTQLSEPNAPLVLADGTCIDPKTGRAIREHKFVEVPTNKEAVRQVTATRKRLADLPAPPKQMNAISVVCFYSMLGLDTRDIAIATGLSEDQIGKMRMLDAYVQVQSSIVQSVVEQDADDVRQMFTANARHMATRLAELADDEDSRVAVAAVNSFLDRAGHRPADVVEHKHKVEGDLRIEFIKRDETQKVPTIDLTTENEDGYDS